jgi:hypothetical protein
MSSINIDLYTILKTDFKLSDAKAKEFAQAIKEEVQLDIKYENSDFRSSVREDFLKLELKLEQNKSDILKWFISPFITLFLMILGLYATILLK